MLSSFPFMRLRVAFLRSCSGHGSGGSSPPPPTPPAVSDCYACTQPGAPSFHSTSCDRAHSPEWEASAGSSLLPIGSAALPRSAPLTADSIDHRRRWVLDPRTRRVQRWNRALLLARALSLAVDPLFFYSLSVVGAGGDGAVCIYVDGRLAAAVAAARTCVDAAHLVHVWLQLRVAYVSRESLVVGCGKLVWDARAIALHYLTSLNGFWFDIFVILPVPQAVFWFAVPRLIREEDIRLITTMLLLMFLFQFLPKAYHSICVMRRMRKVTGYIFGTIWWGFGLNLIAYFIASHVAGGCWYVLAIQRVASCLQQQCKKNKNCDLVSLACSREVCYRVSLPLGMGEPLCDSKLRSAPVNQTMPVCLDMNGPFKYGIYNLALPVVSSNSLAIKTLYPIFWGLMSLSTFGNDLEPTSHWLEVIFSIIIVLSGLMLFTLLVGNIQVFLHAVMASKRKMQVRCRDMEWWMKRRQLPSRLRQRVRRYERERWTTMQGEDETGMIKDLPDGLRRDIKSHLCIALIKKVPLFHNMDDLVLQNICDRVKPLLFSKGEKVIREGDPVQRMVFIVKGELLCSQALSKGMVATCMLGPGNFIGDELFSWCLRRPFIDRLPASSSSFECTEATEAFGLDAGDLRYITEHFRYQFASERLKRTARYYSSSWRTWGAINIQLAWRRYKGGNVGRSVCRVQESGDDDHRLRMYASIFMSLRPHDYLQ